mmetsp:Transcript_56430/g.127318  ORF Transcript_56430/g.127318 Transcript_56430/m.127318 type:complete len:109 (-) Transcript_56430:210-536(-)
MFKRGSTLQQSSNRIRTLTLESDGILAVPESTQYSKAGRPHNSSIVFVEPQGDSSVVTVLDSASQRLETQMFASDRRLDAMQDSQYLIRLLSNGTNHSSIAVSVYFGL